MVAGSTEGWYLVYCKPRQELIARRNLGRQGYQTYLPLIRETKRRLGRRMNVVTPMFPRYLFIRLNTETDNWGPIRSTLGVVSLVRFGQMPSLVPESFVRMLKGREDEEGLQLLPTKGFQSGEAVRITDGGFAGYEAIFLARSARDRVTVLLDVLGRQTPVQLRSDFVEHEDN